MVSAGDLRCLLPNVELFTAFPFRPGFALHAWVVERCVLCPASICTCIAALRSVSQFTETHKNAQTLIERRTNKKKALHDNVAIASSGS